MPIANVHGLDVYYEIHGEGEPLVLLHGGVHGIAGVTTMLSGLSAARRVIAVELQAHGRTGDREGPLSWEVMADDIAGLMAELDIERADWMGYSLGAGVALRAAIRHPAAVRRLVLLSAPFKRQGWYPEVLEGMAQLGPAAAEGMRQSPLARIYPNLDWGVLFTKLRDLLAQDYDLSREVAALKMPVMLVFADADAIPPAHMAEFYNLLGGGLRDAGLDGSLRPVARLAVLPGRTHYDAGESPVLPGLVNAFLEAPDAGR
jgi:pimeloyl-ACP methyl ester carboxylesterase